MSTHVLPVMANAVPVPLADVPHWAFGDFRTAVLDEIAQGNFLSAFFGVPSGPNGVRLYAVVTRPEAGTIGIGPTGSNVRSPSNGRSSRSGTRGSSRSGSTHRTGTSVTPGGGNRIRSSPGSLTSSARPEPKRTR
jgi:hypothetical protein